VTLSNEGTEPGTLTVFDQVRFSWSGKDCTDNHAHPRRAEVRMTIDFKHVADRLAIFGIAFKKRLAGMAGVPESSLRLTGLRSGSIIAELLVLPRVVDKDLPTHDFKVSSAIHSIELLRNAVSKNAAELCALTGGPLEGCNVELKDLGFAMPSVKALPVPKTVLEQQESSTQADGTANVNNVIIVVCAVAAAGLLLFAVYRLYLARSLKTKIPSKNSNTQSCEIKVQSVVEDSNLRAASMEEGHSVKILNVEKPVEQDNDNSTVCPSITGSIKGVTGLVDCTDEQSEVSLSDNADVSTFEQGVSVVKIPSKNSRNS